MTLTKPRSLTQESVDKRDSSSSDPPMLRSRRGRQPLMMGLDTKVFVVWLENFEDHENFPAGRANTGHLHGYLPLPLPLLVQCF